MPSSTSSRMDDIVVLNVGGRMFKCHRTTLTNAGGSYFAKRFGENSTIPAGDMYRDDQGHAVYFIDRDGDPFEYILRFLRNGDLVGFPSFSEDPGLWRRLRSEADFYFLEGLSDLLQVTHSCLFNTNFDRGVLHWLGTEKGTKEYQNPHKIRAVHVGGWLDMTFDEVAALVGITADEHQSRSRDIFRREKLTCGRPGMREPLVHYRPKIRGISPEGMSSITPLTIQNAMTYPGDTPIWRGLCGYPTVIELRDIWLRPTHCSLRWAAVTLNPCWSFEGSNDGSNWEVLHRCSQGPNGLTTEEVQSIMDALDGYEEDDVDIVNSTLLAHAEKRCRTTWAVESSTFYKYFRFLGTRGGFFGVGLELYGDIHED